MDRNFNLGFLSDSSEDNTIFITQEPCEKAGADSSEDQELALDLENVMESSKDIGNDSTECVMIDNNSEVECDEKEDLNDGDNGKLKVEDTRFIGSITPTRLVLTWSKLSTTDYFDTFIIMIKKCSAQHGCLLTPVTLIELIDEFTSSALQFHVSTTIATCFGT